MRREEDARAVVALCPRCHACHSPRGVSSRVLCGVAYPGISNANMVWLKRERDAELFDAEYLQRVWLGCVPEPEPPPEFYQLEYEQAKGRRYCR